MDAVGENRISMDWRTARRKNKGLIMKRDPKMCRHCREGEEVKFKTSETGVTTGFHTVTRGEKNPITTVVSCPASYIIRPSKFERMPGRLALAELIGH